MYGLIIGGIQDTITKKFGEDTWRTISTKSGIRSTNYLPKKSYSETIVPRVIKMAVEVTGMPQNELLQECGVSFLSYITNYGYDRLLMVLGRELRDFINSLDNLHDYIRVSYPKLNPPSFFCENETESGLTLHYRSRRRGFQHYVIGQITEIAKVLYNTDIHVELLTEEETVTINHCVMRLNFDNAAYSGRQQSQGQETRTLPVTSQVISEVFPFHLIFGSDMLIRGLGDGLAKVMPHAMGQAVDELFTLVRPQSEFSMETIMGYSNCAFELVSCQSLRRDLDSQGDTVNNTLDMDSKTTKHMLERRLRLKGQMSYFEKGDAVLYLGTPLMLSLDTMFDMGIFINDLSIHDSSRDLVLASTQQATELSVALTMEKTKSAKLSEMLASVDKEMKRTDALLYQMIPKAVATRLRNGEPSMNTCQIFESVTILFTDVVGFTSICSRLTPMMVVDMLNEMYSRFDLLTVKHRVYKVETIGDAYMVVSGAPNVTTFHAVYICNMAFDMVDAMQSMEDPSQGPGSNMNIRVGIHTGPVVGGVVGVKMPRYCLVGLSVQIANKMESSGSAMRIHISLTTRRELEKYPFLVEPDGLVPLQSGGTIKAFWLTGKDPDSNVKIPMAGGAEGQDD